MAQAKRTPQKKLRLEDVFGTPEERKAERDAVARLMRRYGRYRGTIEEARVVVDRDMGDKLLSDYVLEGHGHVFKDGRWQ